MSDEPTTTAKAVEDRLQRLVDRARAMVDVLGSVVERRAQDVTQIDATLKSPAATSKMSKEAIARLHQRREERVGERTDVERLASGISELGAELDGARGYLVETAVAAELLRRTIAEQQQTITELQTMVEALTGSSELGEEALLAMANVSEQPAPSWPHAAPRDAPSPSTPPAAAPPPAAPPQAAPPQPAPPQAAPPQAAPPQAAPPQATPPQAAPSQPPPQPSPPVQENPLLSVDPSQDWMNLDAILGEQASSDAAPPRPNTPGDPDGWAGMDGMDELLEELPAARAHQPAPTAAGAPRLSPFPTPASQPSPSSPSSPSSQPSPGSQPSQASPASKAARTPVVPAHMAHASVTVRDAPASTPPASNHAAPARAETGSASDPVPLPSLGIDLPAFDFDDDPAAPSAAQRAFTQPMAPPLPQPPAQQQPPLRAQPPQQPPAQQQPQQRAAPPAVTPQPQQPPPPARPVAKDNIESTAADDEMQMTIGVTLKTIIKAAKRMPAPPDEPLVAQIAKVLAGDPPPMTVQALAERASVPPELVRRKISELKAKGFLEIVRAK